MRDLRNLIAIAGLGLAGPLLAQFTPTQTALFQFYAESRIFNIVTFGDFTRTSSGQDTQGSALVLGNLNLTGGRGYSFMNSPGVVTKGYGADPDLIVFGRFSFGPGAHGQLMLNNGVVAVNRVTTLGLNWNASNQSLTNGANNVSLPGNNNGGGDPQAVFNNWVLTTGYDPLLVRSRMLDASNTLKAQSNQNTAAGTGLANNTLTVNANAGAIAFFNVDQAQLAGLNQINLSVPANSVLVINVHGASGGTFPQTNAIGTTTASAARVLWNFTGTAAGVQDSGTFGYTLGTGGGTLWGSILAPRANLNAQTVVEGQVMANSWSQGNVELHVEPFLPDVFLIPEPQTVAAVLGGLALALAAGRRRRS